MFRIFSIILWLAGTISAIVFVSSGYFFGHWPARQYLQSLALAIVATTRSATKVDTGHVGPKIRFGKVVEVPPPVNLFFVNPFTTSMVQMDTRVQKWDGKIAGVFDGRGRAVHQPEHQVTLAPA